MFRGLISSIFMLMAWGLHGQSVLLSANEMFENSQLDSNIVFLDIRDSAFYEDSHVSGAINIGSRSHYGCQDCEIKGLKIGKSELETYLGGLGISNANSLYLYDDRGGVSASRLWWILKNYGFEKAKILNGGFKSWERAGLPVSKDVIRRDPIQFSFSCDSNCVFDIASKEDVIIAQGDSSTVIIDTRTLEEFEGKIKKGSSARAGRIPGSIWIDWSAAIDYYGNQEFHSTDSLKKLFDSKGVTSDKSIITYCQSGTRSAHTVFVLTQLLGFSDVKNYDGSWIEWSADLTLPIDTGAVEIAVAEYNPTYWEVFSSSFASFIGYTWSEITFQARPIYVNYFWMLTFLSIIVWLLEIAFPWRKNQPIFRKDFWLDAFYMYFNFYIFKIIIFMAFSNLTEKLFTDLVGGDISRLALLDMSEWHWALQLLIFFVGVDFIQWFTHVLLHRFDFLWRFHKVHHSVEQMGFAAHLRYHWMENVFYTPMKFMAMMLIGNFGPEQAFIVYYISIAIGHLNHANLNLSYGPLKYVINNPKMHIWHHAHELPESRRHGVNFGISLSCWDYIFRTNYIPSDGRDIKLGFEGLKRFPSSFFGQLFSGFRNRK